MKLTRNTTIQEILSVPQAAAALEAQYPALVQHLMTGAAQGMTVHQCAAAAPQLFTPQMLAQMETLLASLDDGGPRPVRVGYINLGNSPLRRYMRKKYLDRLHQAGAETVRFELDVTTDVLEKAAGEMDGFLFCGGADIDPALYGEEKQPYCAEQMPARDVLEAIWFRLAMATGKPVLGICRGLQLFNVLMGGTLYQDINVQKPGTRNHSSFVTRASWCHKVTVQPDTLLSDITGKPGAEIKVNSIHHQGVKDLAPGLRVSAISEDGIPEALENPAYPSYWLAVQWHPEHMGGHDAAQQAIFQRFVDAALKARNQ